MRQFTLAAICTRLTFVRLAVQVLREQDVQVLRAIYDTAHEAILQQRQSLETLDARNVLDLAGVPIEKANRLFDIDSLTNDVLRADVQADQQFIADGEPMQTSVQQSFEEFGERLQMNDPVENAWIAREIVRRATLAHSEQMSTRETWELQTLSLEVDASSPAEDHERLATLIRVDAVQRLRLHELYDSTLKAFGLRPAEPMTPADFAAGAMSTIEGVIMSASNDMPTLMRPTGPDGQLVKWSLIGAVFEAYVLASVEIDPFSDIAFDLSVWH